MELIDVSGVTGGLARPTGKATFNVIRHAPPFQTARSTTEWIRRAIREGYPSMALPKEVRLWRFRNLRHLVPGMRAIALARLLEIPHFHGALWLEVIRAGGYRLDLGLVGLRKVSTVGVGFIVDAFQNIVEAEIMKYHGIGTGATAEGDETTLVTELTTEYNPDNTRATGNLAEGASGNIFHTEATNTLDGTPGAALREHSVFSLAAVASGVLLDRTVYGAITLFERRRAALQVRTDA